MGEGHFEPVRANFSQTDHRRPVSRDKRHGHPQGLYFLIDVISAPLRRCVTFEARRNEVCMTDSLSGIDRVKMHGGDGAHNQQERNQTTATTKTMLISPSILSYMLFTTIESGLYIYLAVIYLRRMHEYSWDSNVPAERYILVALWVGAFVFTVSTVTNVHTITWKNWEFIQHLVTILNATERSMTMGVTVLLSSGRSLSTSLALGIVGYAATCVGISKFVTYQAHKDTYNPRKVPLIAYVWPTMVDLLICGYSLYLLQRTIVTLELTNQTRKLDRYLWLRRLLILVTFILLLRQLLMLFTDSSTYRWAEVELDQAAFFLTLAGIGYLWRPSPANRDFENVVELQPADLLEMQSPLFAIAEVHHHEQHDERQ
jgi:hypothetical protein